MVQAVSLIVESLFTMRNRETGEVEGAMFLMEEALRPDGQCLATICMREDGLFEGRLYKLGRGAEGASDTQGQRGDAYELCGVAETLSRIRTIVYEELGLDVDGGLNSASASGQR